METVTPIRMFSILVLDICGYVYIEKIKGVKEGERNTNVCYLCPGECVKLCPGVCTL